MRSTVLPSAVQKQSKLAACASTTNVRVSGILIVALVVAFAAFLIPQETLRSALLGASAAALSLLGLMWVMRQTAGRRQRMVRTVMRDLFGNDQTPAMLANADGEVLFSNASADRRLPTASIQTVAASLSKTLANPAAIVRRLQAKAAREGSAWEELATRNANHKLKVHLLEDGFFLWRLEESPWPKSAVGGYEPPMILVGPDDVVLHANAPAAQLLGDKIQSLHQIFSEMPVVSGKVATLTGGHEQDQVLVVESEAGARRRAIYLLPAKSEDQTSEDWNVFQNLPVPLLKVAPDGHVREFNKMAAKLIGQSLERNTHLADLMEGLGRPITDWLRDTLAGKGQQRSEFLRLKRPDKEAFVQISLNRLNEADGPSLIAVLNDATELKTLEAQFVQSQKMQAIGQLAGGVAHDFNNLLTAISGHCDLLLLRHDQGDPDFSDLVQINQNANRAAALVGQLLAFSRKQTLRPETLDMRDTLSDLTHLLNRLVGEKVTLTLKHDPILQPIRADKRQLEQVLMNLVVNARDAMPNGGEIRIVTEVTHISEPLQRDRVTVPVGDYVTVQVFDEGVGIPSDKLQKVFEPFFTTKRTGEGTGLGLSTAYGIVKQTGGYIFVDSTLGAGTCFTLYFPVLESAQPSHPAITAERPKQVSKHRDGVILLVEDEAPVRAFASRALRLRGYTVLEAESAEAALKTLEDETLNIDVFVTDVVMPGMDGPSWVREALKQRPEVRVVFVSGYAEDSFGEEQTRIPNSVFLPKPFSLNDLTDTVRQQMH